MKTSPREAFSLVEMMVAMGVLMLMMAFMFTMVTQSISAWEVGSRRMESGQSARIGMNLIAQELQFAFAGVKTNAGVAAGSVFTNAVPLIGTNGIPGERSGSIQAVPGSGSLFFVSPIGPFGGGTGYRPFAEVGYLCYFLGGTGANTMAGQRYYLVRHGDQPGMTRDPNRQNFYYRRDPDSAWISGPGEGSTTTNRIPLVDNCIRVQFQFARTNNAGVVSWTNSWPVQTDMPLGVLVTMLVMDTKTANRIASLKSNNVLTAAEIDSATNFSGTASSPVQRVLREGTTILRRFVPLINAGR